MRRYLSAVAILTFLILPLASWSTEVTGYAVAEKYCTVYSKPNWSGYYATFTEDIYNLGLYNWANSIDSVTVLGLWIFYENINYNMQPGQVYWIYGIHYAVNLPSFIANRISSLCSIGPPLHCLNCDSWTIFQGEIFTGIQLFGMGDAGTLDPLDSQAASLIITGESPWTAYSAPYFQGDSVCFYPNVRTKAVDGMRMTLGLFSKLYHLSNKIRSLRRGCFSRSVVAKEDPLQTEAASATGSWGYLSQ